jgi:hypothetical protein
MDIFMSLDAFLRGCTVAPKKVVANLLLLYLVVIDSS